MKNIYAVIILLLFSVQAIAQEGNWDVYLAQYEKGVGSTTLNMDLIKVAPQKDLPFILITGVTYNQCRTDGLPESEEFNKLYEISDQVGQVVSALTKTETAGSFTHQCERLDYIYVRDTLQIREKLTALYSSKYKPYKFYLNIKPDPNWDAYRKFLYPNEVTQEYMANEKVLVHLRDAGDNLVKPRLIDHWLYFANKKDRALFVNYSEKGNFKINSTDHVRNAKLPYQLHISRVDHVHPEAINNLTLELRKKAKELNGKYDGWETIVLKD